MSFLREAGYTLQAQGDDLFVEPRENLSPAECDQIRLLKPGMIAILAEERWAECGTCKASIDTECSVDVGRVCERMNCPYRTSLSLRRPLLATSRLAGSALKRI